MSDYELSPSQIQAFYDRIQLPQHYREIRHPNLKLLTALQQYSLAHIPFENFSIHYSKAHEVDISAEKVFQKIVVRNNGRGGYCMENNLLMNCILRALGYNIYATGARIVVDKEGIPTYQGWTHMVNLVTVEGQKYWIDIGYGSNGITSPTPLIEGFHGPACGSSEILVTRHCPIGARTSPPNTSSASMKSPSSSDTTLQATDQVPGQKLWHLNYRHDKNKPWMTAYAFTELEFLPNDFAVANFWTSKSPQIFFTTSVVCIKMQFSGGPESVEGDYGKERLCGHITICDTRFKKFRDGLQQEAFDFSDETHRVQCIRDTFGIELSDEEKDAIIGTTTELKRHA